MNTNQQPDTYLSLISKYKIPAGCNPFDYVLSQPRPSLVKCFEIIEDVEYRGYSKNPDHVLSKGAACGLTEAEVCQHFEPGLTFCGFCEGQTLNTAVVQSRGSVLLGLIELITEHDRGKEVFVHSVNRFSLRAIPGSSVIGQIRYVQHGKAAVAFRRAGDVRPLSLLVED